MPQPQCPAGHLAVSADRILVVESSQNGATEARAARVTKGIAPGCRPFMNFGTLVA